MSTIGLLSPSFLKGRGEAGGMKVPLQASTCPFSPPIRLKAVLNGGETGADGGLMWSSPGSAPCPFHATLRLFFLLLPCVLAIQATTVPSFTSVCWPGDTHLQRCVGAPERCWFGPRPDDDRVHHL